MTYLIAVTMWGNGIALPPALYVMQGIADALYHALVRANLPEHCQGHGQAVGGE